jgi:hypothetical protein
VINSCFDGINIDEITTKNYQEFLPPGIAKQVAPFLPPEGSFTTPVLRRYLHNLKDYATEDEYASYTLANRLRIAFSDLKPDTICRRFPRADINLRRRLRCVAEYLIRTHEFDKLKDQDGKLIKRPGLMGKMVVIYQPLPKILTVLQKQGLMK